MKILDLPGAYSLFPYSAEEIFARDFIVKERPDCVIDILDGTSLERNLYLALQIMETGIPTVLGIYMMDEVALHNDTIDFKRLEAEFGVEVVPLEARNGKGIDALMDAVSRTIQEKRLPKRLPVYALSGKVDEDTLADKCYSFITEVVGFSVLRGTKEGEQTSSRSDKIDKVLTHKIWALPVFASIMYLMFAATFSENFLFIHGLPSPGIALATLVENL